jgi:hypothetical protein
MARKAKRPGANVVRLAARLVAAMKEIDRMPVEPVGKRGSKRTRRASR